MDDFQEYPKWKYNPTQEPVIVQDADSEAALGDGWADSPFADEPLSPLEISEGSGTRKRTRRKAPSE